MECIAHVDHLQDVLRLHVLFIQSISVSFICTQVMDDLLRRLVFLLRGQVVRRRTAVHIGDKTQPLRLAGLVKLIISFRIQRDPEGIDHRISVLLHDLKDLFQDSVDLFISLGNRQIGIRHILDRDRVYQLVICQKVSVPVIDIPTRRIRLFRLSDLKFVFFHIFLPSYDLQIKQAADQDRRGQAEYDQEDRQPGTAQLHHCIFKFLFEFQHIYTAFLIYSSQKA